MNRAMIGRLLFALCLCLAAPAVARGPESYPTPTREAMVAVPGGRVYVRVNGDLAGPRPPVVFLHGGPGGVSATYLDALALADERAVILYDQLDSGRSDRPNDAKNWKVARFVDELEAVRTALGVKRWHVVGHSWGGTIALEYAARHPDALASVVLASPLISTKSWLADAAILRRQLPAPVQTDLSRCERPRPPSDEICDAAMMAFYKAFNGRVGASDGVRDAMKASGGMNERIYNAMWGKSEFSSTGTLRNYNGEPLLARLPGARTLFMVGQYDEARPETVGRFAARTPGAEFAVIPGAAHGTFTDRPVETIAILRGWMERHDPS